MTDKFIEKAKEVHGDKYDYSKTVYQNNLKEVVIICDIHGEFLQLPKTHKKGNGCIPCGRERTSLARKSNVDEFIQKANEVHNNKYDYSKVQYNKASEKVIIICIEHGEFLQTPNGHLGGAGCRKCSTQRNSDKARKRTEEFIKESIEKHGDNYDYSKVEYKNTKENVIILCKEHGEFLQTPSNHLKGTRCPLCSIIKGGLLRRKINPLSYLQSLYHFSA
jgi:cytochrome c2